MARDVILEFRTNREQFRSFKLRDFLLVVLNEFIYPQNMSSSSIALEADDERTEVSSVVSTDSMEARFASSIQAELRLYSVLYR